MTCDLPVDRSRCLICHSPSRSISLSEKKEEEEEEPAVEGPARPVVVVVVAAVVHQPTQQSISHLMNTIDMQDA